MRVRLSKRCIETITVLELEDGTRKTATSYTLDGKWKIERDKLVKGKVVAWSLLPIPYKK